MFVRKLVLPVVLIVFSLVGAGFGHAQTTSGALVGVIRDASGAVVPNSTVNAINEATGVVYTGKSNASGDYRISNLPEGTYDLRTAVPGFMPSALKGVVVAATSVETQDIVLSVGQTTTTVEVTTLANVSIDTTTAQIGTTFSTKETQDLPSATIGLGVLNLSLLTPGVTSSGGLGAGTGPRSPDSVRAITTSPSTESTITTRASQDRCSMCPTMRSPSSSCCRTSTLRNTATLPEASSTA